jgi:hypothetical protein
MNVKAIILVLLIVLCGSNTADAQIQLGFGSNGVDHADTVQYGDPITFSFHIVNQSNSTVIQDSISINLTVWDQFLQLSNNISLGSYMTPSGSLSSGDSLSIIYTTTVTQQMYFLGDNLVVIWPGLVAPSFPDTSITTVHVLGNPASIKEHISKAKLLKVTDILGRETKGTKKEPLFYIYDDGTVEKRIVIE